MTPSMFSRKCAAEVRINGQQEKERQDWAYRNGMVTAQQQGDTEGEEAESQTCSSDRLLHVLQHPLPMSPEHFFLFSL